ncbi:hypothetical protein D3C71_2108790 [compost metagenome]
MIDPTFRYNLARAAWEKAKKTYSLNRVLRQLKSVYERYQVAEPTELNDPKDQND